MRTTLTAALLTVLTVAPARAAEPTLAAEVRALLATRYAAADAGDPVKVVPVPRPKPPEWTELTADPDGHVWLSAGDGAAEWEVLDPGATVLVPPGSSVAVFAAAGPGRYRVIAVAGGKLVRCVVVVGNVPPGPGPKPPAPPEPIDPLVAKLRAAYAADPGPEKAADLKKLVALYLEAVTFARQDGFATAADLFGAVSAAAASLLPADPTTGARRLDGVRRVISAELVNVLPTDPAAPLTEEVRGQAAAAFGRYAKALQGVVP